jgi:hypothetical protein
MSVNQFDEFQNLIHTESGIITPTFFKGILSIPVDESITIEEKYYAEALMRVLENKDYKDNIINHNEKLLLKFDLEKVANNYLS